MGYGRVSPSRVFVWVSVMGLCVMFVALFVLCVCAVTSLCASPHHCGRALMSVG